MYLFYKLDLLLYLLLILSSVYIHIIKYKFIWLFSFIYFIILGAKCA